jgi:uncharacterized hydantoinase/oxoprolinase family protein
VDRALHPGMCVFTKIDSCDFSLSAINLKTKMSAKPLEADSDFSPHASRQAELTLSLKTWTTKVSDLSTQRAQLTGKIYRAAFEWVTISNMRDSTKSIGAGVKRLADTLDKANASVHRWYNLGSFMHTNDLNADRCDSGAVRTLYAAFNLISGADQKRGVQLIKGGATGKDIVKLLRKSKTYASRQALNRATRLALTGTLTDGRIVLEGRAFKALCQKYFRTKEIEIRVLKDNRIVKSI